MALQLLLDYLTGQMALVNVIGGTVTPPTPSYFVPAFAGFILIPQ
jgi:hypothetical protein